MKYRTAKANGMYAGELQVPAEAEKSLYFGPSMAIQQVGLTGIENKVILWVGGAGLDKDGKWGHPIQFVWTQPPDVDKAIATAQAKLILRESFDQLRHHYTTQTARIILSMLENCIDGHVYKKLFSREEAEEFNHV